VEDQCLAVALGEVDAAAVDAQRPVGLDGCLSVVVVGLEDDVVVDDTDAVVVVEVDRDVGGGRRRGGEEREHCQRQGGGEEVSGRRTALGVHGCVSAMRRFSVAIAGYYAGLGGRVSSACRIRARGGLP